MDELAQFASNRGNATWASPHRVVVVSLDGGDFLVQHRSSGLGSMYQSSRLWAGGVWVIGGPVVERVFPNIYEEHFYTYHKPTVLVSLAPVNRRGALSDLRGCMATTAMTPDYAIELSIEQLVGMLNKKMFMECVRVQSAMPPMSRAQAATMTAEVRSQELEEDLEC